jgi:hypothetical protein
MVLVMLQTFPKGNLDVSWNRCSRPLPTLGKSLAYARQRLSTVRWRHLGLDASDLLQTHTDHYLGTSFRYCTSLHRYPGSTLMDRLRPDFGGPMEGKERTKPEKKEEKNKKIKRAQI